MRVFIIQAVALEVGKTLYPEEEHDVPDAVGQRWLAAGYVEEVTDGNGPFRSDASPDSDPAGDENG